MDRRRLLAAVATGAAALSGCAYAPNRARDRRTATSTREYDPSHLVDNGVPRSVCEEDPDDDPGIYAITGPTFGDDWAGRDVDGIYRVEGTAGLADEQTVIGVERGGAARAYPVSVLWHHEIVNDEVGAGGSGDESDEGEPILVTYCPLCESAMVADRRVDGVAATFTVTGLLWKAPRIREGAAEEEDRVFGAETTGGEERSVRHAGNLVMLDDVTDSYWSQILARGLCGPKEGEYLDVVPSTVATWAEWREDRPETDILLPPPHSGTSNPAQS